MDTDCDRCVAHGVTGHFPWGNLLRLGKGPPQEWITIPPDVQIRIATDCVDSGLETSYFRTWPGLRSRPVGAHRPDAVGHGTPRSAENRP